MVKSLGVDLRLHRTGVARLANSLMLPHAAQMASEVLRAASNATPVLLSLISTGPHRWLFWFYTSVPQLFITFPSMLSCLSY